MNDIEEDPTFQVPIPLVYNMLDIVILRSSFNAGIGLENNSNRITEPIMILEKSFRYGLEYMPIKKDKENAKLKKIEIGLPTPLPNLY